VFRIAWEREDRDMEVCRAVSALVDEVRLVVAGVGGGGAERELFRERGETAAGRLLIFGWGLV
jgi:hypothetical protein